jgi:hypothetical protein
VLSSRVLLAALIAAATALFAVGVSIERGQSDKHSSERIERPGESGEGPAADTGGEGEERHVPTTAGELGHDTHEEPRILGIDPESTALVILATIASLLLVAAVLRWPRAVALLALVALAMLAFAALDTREVIHQLDEDHAGVAILAGAIAVLHLVAAGVAAARARADTEQPPTSTASA